MNNGEEDRLYKLLPAIYRSKDADAGEPLRAILKIIEEELKALELDVSKLYDNWFIETCDEWVVPYIGDLLGVRPLGSSGPGEMSLRAYVANTISYRRSKGTLTTLERLARDVTGWPAKAVEFFELLAVMQSINHLRRGKSQTLGLRDIDGLELLGGPFEGIAHTAEVRGIQSSSGRYNVSNVGLFFWRIQSYPMEDVIARAVAGPHDGRYTFSPLGNDIPLYNPHSRAVRCEANAIPAPLAREIDMPGELRRLVLYRELEDRRQANGKGPVPQAIYFGKEPVLKVFVKYTYGPEPENPIPPEGIQICDLTDWRKPPILYPTNEGENTHQPIDVAVDPALGRIAISSSDNIEHVRVSYAYGFSGDLGGGPYQRNQTFSDPVEVEWRISVSKMDMGTDISSTINDALHKWSEWLKEASDKRANAIITIIDSCTYSEKIEITLPKGARLTLQADNGERPTICLQDSYGGIGDLVMRGDEGEEASLTLNGLLLEGGIYVEDKGLDQLSITHCTLVPGRRLRSDGHPLYPDIPSITFEAPNANAKLYLDHCIIGALNLPEDLGGVWVTDCIVDAPEVDISAMQVNLLILKDIIVDHLLNIDQDEEVWIKITVTIDGDCSSDIVFSWPSGTFALDDALLRLASNLQQALRGSQENEALSHAWVTLYEENSTGVPDNKKNLMIVPGAPEVSLTIVDAQISITQRGNTTTYPLLGFPINSERRHGFISASLSPFPELRSKKPEIRISYGTEEPEAYIISIPQPSDLLSAKDAIEATIKGCSQSNAFKCARVMLVEDRLLVLSGDPSGPLQFDYSENDAITLTQIRFRTFQEIPRAAICAVGANTAGPSAWFERATVFGEVHVRDLPLASQAIFTGRVSVLRQQVGCMRFSYAPDDSKVPARYQCQPGLALAKRAEELGLSSVENLQSSERESILAHLRPIFSSEHYGDPDYAQLSLTCAEEIRSGGEGGTEMGAFNYLQQPQREASLRSILNEYLRAGLRAGLFYVN